MRAVIDINILLKMAANGEHSPLMIAWMESRFQLFISDEIMEELEIVLKRPGIQRFVRGRRGEQFKVTLRERAAFVKPADEAPRCRDPKDDIVIATAVSAQADFLVTADKDLYDDPELVASMNKLGIQIVLPPEFLRSLSIED